MNIIKSILMVDLSWKSATTFRIWNQQKLKCNQQNKKWNRSGFIKGKREIVSILPSLDNYIAEDWYNKCIRLLRYIFARKACKHGHFRRFLFSSTKADDRAEPWFLPLKRRFCTQPSFCRRKIVNEQSFWCKSRFLVHCLCDYSVRA